MFKNHKDVVKAQARIAKRRAKLRSLAPPGTHRAIAVRLQTAHAVLGVCEGMVFELIESSLAYLERAQPAKGAIRQISDAAYSHTLWRLISAIDEISRARDSKAIKLLSWDVVKLLLKWGTKPLPVRYDDVKDLAEVLGAAEDAASVAKASKLRRQQVAAATDLLTWLDALHLLALAWAFEAHRHIATAQGRGILKDTAVFAELEKLVVKQSKDWK